MINVIKKEIDMEESLKKRLEIICDFCNTTPTIINGSIRKIDKTNLNYIEPHRIIINNIMFLAFNYSIANKKSLELDNHTKEVKEIITDLKTTLTSKEKYVLKQEDKDKLVSYIDSVSKTNEEYTKIQTLSVILNNVDTEIKENRDKIKTLTKNNEVLTLRVENLTKNIKSKDKEIEKLKEENHSLKTILEFWKDKFLRVMSLIKDKLVKKKNAKNTLMYQKVYTKKVLSKKILLMS